MAAAVMPTMPRQMRITAVGAITISPANVPKRLHLEGIARKSVPRPINAGDVPKPKACMSAMLVTGSAAAALRATIAYSSPQGRSAALTPKKSGARISPSCRESRRTEN